MDTFCGQLGIEQLCVECDHKHSHAPWRFAVDNEGRRVWATSLESQYPRKLCIAVVQSILQSLGDRGLTLLPGSIQDLDTHPLMRAQQAQIATGHQPHRKKLPPLVPDSDAVVTACIPHPSVVDTPLLGKTCEALHLHSTELQPLVIPPASRFLRSYCSTPESISRGEVSRDSEAASSVSGADLSGYPFRAIFGLPWKPGDFIQRTAKVGHPGAANIVIPEDFDIAIDRNIEWSDEQLTKYRMDWCKQWLSRASKLDKLESEDRMRRPEHVRSNTMNKRLLLTKEILESIQYQDLEALEILRRGATLAGSITKCAIFEEQFKPCLMTVGQLESGAARRNQAILAMTTTSGDAALDKQLLEETKLEIERQWARGPFELSDLPAGSVISRRFPLVQGNKIRLIDDFSISGVNDSCTINAKIDLHMIDTLGAVARKFFQWCKARGWDSSLRAKTFDLKTAYRQVSIREDHLKYSYFRVYNWERDKPEIYQMVTLPFGATHSVYNFLRLARLIHSVAARGLYLINTNFYDDFVLLSKPASCVSNNAMEILFMLLGWEYARERKPRNFQWSAKLLVLSLILARTAPYVCLQHRATQAGLDIKAF